jgi:undecaprenyl-diphosphatase
MAVSSVNSGDESINGNNPRRILLQIEEAEYSFLLGLVTLFLATVFKLVKNHGAFFSYFALSMFVVGIFAVFIFSVLTIKIFFNFLTANGMCPFAWYRILLRILLANSNCPHYGKIALPPRGK